MPVRKLFLWRLQMQDEIGGFRLYPLFGHSRRYERKNNNRGLMTKYFFPHEYNARNDRKLKLVRNKFKSIGKELYWDIVEMLYCEDGYLPIVDIPVIAEDYGVTPEFVNELIDLQIGDGETLFQRNETHFWSDSVLERIKIIKAKSEKARKSAEYRWGGFDDEEEPPEPPKEPKKPKKPKKPKEKSEYLKIEGIDYTNLTQEEFGKLEKKNGKDLLLKAIQIFDVWLGKKGKTAMQYIGKPHINHFRKDGWMWEQAREALNKEKVKSETNNSYGRY